MNRGARVGRSRTSQAIAAGSLAAVVLCAGCTVGTTSGTSPPAPPAQAHRPEIKPQSPTVAAKDTAAPPPGAQPSEGIGSRRPSREELEQRIAEQSKLYDKLLANPPTSPPATSPTSAATPAAATPAAPPVIASREPEPSSIALSAVTELPKVELPKPTPVLSAAERIDAQTLELAGAFREQSARSAAPLREYLALAMLDTVKVGVLGKTESGPILDKLNPRQIRNLVAVRDLLKSLSDQPALLSDTERLIAAMQSSADQLASDRDFRVSAARLCTRVDGFGQYEPLRGPALLAGTTHTLVVYTELEGYAQRKSEAGDGPRWSVDVAQAVEVWLDADKPTLQKRWPEQGVSDLSRNRRRDFYLTHVIELPHTLSVGSYNVKVIVRDRAKGALAEHIIPIRIVADPALASAAAR